MPLKNQVMKNNYHTHMYLCKHAVGTVSDYVKKAIELGFETIGMSDHAPFEELKDRSVRMVPSEYPIYLEELEIAIQKYCSLIKIKKGLEIEYFQEHIDRYDELLNTLDYLALGQHYIHDKESFEGLRSVYALSTKEHLQVYADTVTEALSTYNFKFLCHPDLMLYSYPTFDEHAKAASLKIIDAAIKYNIPLEINANGIRKGTRDLPEGKRYLYPRLEFWQLVKEKGAKVIVSSDAHDPEKLWDNDVLQAYEFARQLGIEVEVSLDI